MSNLSWRRLGAGSGVLYVVLLVAGDSLGGTESEVGILLELLGFAVFPFFLGSLWACLRSAEGDDGWLSATAFGAGLVALAIKLGSGAPVLVVRADRTMDPEVVRTLIGINDASFLLTFLPLAVMLSATATVALRHKALPGWLGWAAAAVALGLLASVAAAIVAPSPPDWAFLPMLPYLLWIGATSMALILRKGEPRPAEKAPVPAEPAHVR